jgi:hypothetical protein
MEELMNCYSAKKPFSWHWGNSLYLEWFSQANGRVVIEPTSFQLETDAVPAWTLTEKARLAQQTSNPKAMTEFMERMGTAMTRPQADEDLDDDLPQSPE